ncbi:arylalkylamine N-acetyltransferase-like 2 [Watersipora subatra]|uniref:arylalkylamine N-acetyltransferase-like 2 n=1 Tax=Watersipora subatra TaxID=2589382 RepID=UPI00355C068A
MEDIELQIWHEEKRTRWRELLGPWYNFWHFGTLTTGAMAGENLEEHRKSLDGVFYDHMTYNDLPLIVAWDKKAKKVAGFLFSTSRTVEKTNRKAVIPTHEDPKKPVKDLRNFKKHFSNNHIVKKLEEMDYFLRQLHKEGDAFQRYGVDKVWVISLLSVIPEYTKRGLGSKMSAMVLPLAKELGYTVMISEVTSYYTQRILLEKFQFETILELPFSDYSNYSGVPENVKNTHVNALLVAKKL